ncbi:2-amino-4-hydroxy-6-hydroxymethyldihydropteridine diphosphokinase [Thiohalocapsa halophila]|uniref:2-amino-4-hydroxy-6-hydroxymethyldihydropteridine pyrophosphokinase n=1 Tax=Thiohalocapsa halophila TaxID=69359 RepID=A0ABS1CLJ1_9GAMM|nr:2-amino-4-hydroxy-6-hydroxymethyldihydropteridine diphosphokinase [Thiohalocapsa halophila]MBK1632791.1 2-amino-4-hydroxy-6-hydroxymethyldihydropteridine diphosphokinase [Thiohalocapsa halophila]
MADPVPSALLGRPEVAYIGLGANLDGPREHVERAAVALTALPSSRLEGVSRLYRTAPVGPADQPDYINAAARLVTRLPPRALLTALQGIERAHGRVRDGTRWGPRTLDLDILVFGRRQVTWPGLVLPHPEIHRRAFVLVPLTEVAPADLGIPGQGRLDGLLAAVPKDGVAPLAPIALSLPAGALGPDAAADDSSNGKPPQAALS